LIRSGDVSLNLYVKFDLNFFGKKEKKKKKKKK